MKCKEFLNGLKSSGCYLVYLGSRECIFSLFRYKRIRAHYQGQNYFDGYLWRTVYVVDTPLPSYGGM